MFLFLVPERFLLDDIVHYLEIHWVVGIGQINLDRSIWHIHTKLLDSDFLDRVLKTRCLVCSGPICDLKPIWNLRLWLAQLERGTNNHFSRSLTMLEQILIGLNLPYSGISGWSLFSRTSLPIRHRRLSSRLQNSLLKMN